MSAVGSVSAGRRTPLADGAPPRSGGCGGMNPKMAKRLQELQKENSRRNKVVADQALDILILKEAARPN